MAFRIILARPMFAGNVGACARIGSNFGLEDWSLVNPLCSIDSPEAQKFSTPAGSALLKKFKIQASLEEALADREMAIGFSRRSGTLRRPTFLLSDLSKLNSETKIALVFGNEKSGLDQDELSRCTHICSIPTHPSQPSLNLSHAVAIVAATLFGRPAKLKKLKKSERPSLKEFEALMSHWGRFLKTSGMNEKDNPERVMKKLRKLFGRAELSRSEVDLLHGLLTKSGRELIKAQQSRK